MPDLSILLVSKNNDLIQRISGLYQPDIVNILTVSEINAVKSYLQHKRYDLVILDGDNQEWNSVEVFKKWNNSFPAIPILLFVSNWSEHAAWEGLKLGFFDVLHPKMDQATIKNAFQQAQAQRIALAKWQILETRRNTKSLEKRITDLETLHRIGHKVTSSLDLNHVLKEVIKEAVSLTGAKEGYLMLRDEETGKLVIRAARNFQGDDLDTTEMPINDRLTGQVLHTKAPVLLNEATIGKGRGEIAGHSHLYIPLLSGEQAIGVLGVNNHQGSQTFSGYESSLLTALADYAAIAVQNARFYSETEIEKNKLETILTHIQDGVIVLDPEKQILLINRAARTAFGIGEGKHVGKSVLRVIPNGDLQAILQQPPERLRKGGEIHLADGRIFNSQMTMIPEVGTVITLQDISHLKELDRIKSEFVSTVSHDLRSPLTAILGYTELINRVGPVNDKQQEFIRRVQASVQGITALISDLLDLGKIEAGFDARKETISLEMIINKTVESFSGVLAKKGQFFSLEVAEELPPVWGNAIRLQQMLDNLFGNAINYTNMGGKIGIRAWKESGQLILQVWDSGPGILPSDQPYIFDKFFRGSNLPEESSGTGLGLAIVKSIAEDHQGRVWVESTPEAGSTFTVVLPLYQTPDK